jgi:hypothetical protein
MRPEQTQLLHSISEAFPSDVAHAALSLRQGDEIDSHETPAPDVIPVNWRDVPENELETYHWGFTYLDAESWRFYLPAFLTYSVRYLSRGKSLVVAACLSNLRPPDKVPSRFSTLSVCQRRTVVTVLEFLAFDSESDFTTDACQVLEEYWMEHPLYPDA